MAYNSKGQIIESRHGDRVFNFSYDNLGNLASVTNPLGQITKYTFDLNNRMTSTSLPDQSKLSYRYDLNDNVTLVTLPNGSKYEFEYDPKDRNNLSFEPDIDSRRYSSVFDYNRDNQLLVTKLPDDRIIQNTYNDAGRLKTLVTANGNYGREYHATTGEISALTSPGGNRLVFTRDGNLLTQAKWEGQVNGAVNFSYLKHFRLGSVNVGGNSTAYTYTLDGHVKSAGDLTIIRNSQNNAIMETYLGSTSTQQTYSSFGEIATFDAKSYGQSKLGFAYLRDKLGRITSIESTDDLGNATERKFEYDESGRLKKDSISGGQSITYTYDLNGNRTSEGFVYGEQNRLLETNLASYQYDRNGSLKTRLLKANNTSTTFTYDVVGNLTSVSKPGTSISYIVDGQNRRIGKKINGMFTQGFLYLNQLHPVAEVDGTGNILSTFVYGSRSHVPDYLTKGDRTYRLISDYLGSVRLVVDIESGVVEQKMNYDVWGKVIEDTSPGFQPFGFAGGIYDRDTGLVRFGARDYDAEVGRWTNKDPIRFDGGVNFYVYCDQDPVNYIDISGLARGDWWDPRTYTLPVAEAVGSTYDFGKNYQNMRDANTQGADKYFHCMANCEGSSRGPGGMSAAESISNFREFFDENVKGDSSLSCEQDQVANRAGRAGAGQQCSAVCAPFAPRGLPSRFK